MRAGGLGGRALTQTRGGWWLGGLALSKATRNQIYTHIAAPAAESANHVAALLAQLADCASVSQDD